MEKSRPWWKSKPALAALERAAATLDTLEALEKLGSRAVYLACDVTDFLSVSRRCRPSCRLKAGSMC